MPIQFNWRPDKSSDIPLYIQIKDYIQCKIENGEWTVGTKLPSQRKLSELFDVNRSTIVLAFEELMAEGLIEGKTGSGTQVRNNIWSQLSNTLPTDWNKMAQRGIYQPNLPTIQEIHRVEPLPHIVRLGTGEPSPELFPQTMMTEVLQRLSSKIDSLGYVEEKGLLALREQLCLYLTSIGINISPSCILIVSGAIQALQLISLGLLKSGSTVLLEKPSYLSSLNVFQSAGINLQGLPITQNGLPTHVIRQEKRRHVASLLYTNPTFHNPTGTVMPFAQRQELLQLCEQIQLPIVEDDVYRELWLDETPPRPIKAMDKNGTVLYIGSMSKSLSPGLRIGWVVGPEPVINRLADIKMQTDYGASSLSQWAVAEWLSSGNYFKHLEEMRAALRIRRDLTLKILEQHFKGFAEWKRPTGGFYIWLILPSTISLRELFDKALKEGILINPGNLYDSDSLHHLRLSYAYASLEQLETGLKKLAEIIQQLVVKRR